VVHEKRKASRARTRRRGRNSSPSSSPGTGPGRPTEAAGFADGGAADVMAPGAVLAGLVTAVTGPDGAVLRTLTDEEVLGHSARRSGSRYGRVGGNWSRWPSSSSAAAPTPGPGPLGACSGDLALAP
jgi:hypothetical protein